MAFIYDHTIREVGIVELPKYSDRCKGAILLTSPHTSANTNIQYCTIPLQSFYSHQQKEYLTLTIVNIVIMRIGFPRKILKSEIKMTLTGEWIAQQVVMYNNG